MCVLIDIVKGTYIEKEYRDLNLGERIITV